MQNTRSLKDEKALIDLFKHPVAVIDCVAKIVSLNTTFKNDPLLTQNINGIEQAILCLQENGEDSALIQIENQELCLTAMPMADNRSFIKIAKAKPSTLAKQYNNLVNAIDQMSDAIIICDNDNKVVLVNEQCQQLFPFCHTQPAVNMHIEAFIQQGLKVVQGEKRRESLIYRYLRRKAQLKQSCSFGFTLPNGEYYEYRDSITLDGERIGLLRNETTFKELNVQLESAYTEAHELSQAKSNFMAAMSHEVRTPLNAIIGLLDLCMLEPMLKDHIYISRMQNSAQSLLRLVNDVLDFTKFDANKVELSVVKTNLRNLCEILSEDFMALAEKKQVNFSVFISPELPQDVKVDDIRLIQVLSNLLSNGIKFNDKPNPELSLHVYADPLTQYITFAVSDNGIGIDKSEQTSIFLRFSQANQHIHKQYGGTGLGLSICQKICQLMEGDIYVESQKDAGSTFYVQLPLKSCSAAEIEQIDIAHFDEISLLTNHVLFHKLAALYSKSLKFKVTLLDQLPQQLTSTELLCLDFEKVVDFEELALYPHNQVTIISSKLQDKNPQDYPFIKAPLLRLKDLIRIISSSPVSSPMPFKKTPLVSNFRHIKALIVEDNIENMFVLKQQFKQLKIDGSFAMNAEDAVVYFEQQKYDLIISDYQMPGISGAQLISILRETEKYEKRKKALMIIATADKTQQCREECISSGADKIIMKPLILDNLIALIKENQSLLICHESTPVNNINNEDELLGEAADFDFDEEVFIQELPNASVELNAETTFKIETLRDFIGVLSAKDEIQYLKQFLLNLESVCLNLDENYASKNWSQLSKLAHSLKSSAMIVGAKKLSTLCELLEVESLNSNAVSAQAWDDFHSEVLTLVKNVSGYIKLHE